MMNELGNSYLRGLQEITGYGQELSDALRRYRASTETAAKIKVALALWFKHMPYANHLCSADITFFNFSSSDIATINIKEDIRDSLTLVIAPELGKDGYDNIENYLKALSKYLLAHTMALHAAFQHGLPYVKRANGEFIQLHKSHEVAEFYKSNKGELIGNGVFIAQVKNTASVMTTPKPVRTNIKFCVKETPTYEKATPEWAQEVLNKDINSHFDAWVKLFEEMANDGQLKSSSGIVPAWICALPIISRDVNHPSDVLFISSIFMAFDGTLSFKKVGEALRYVMLYFQEANGTALANLKGELVGKDLAIAPAAHELKNITAALVPGLPKEAYQILREYFNEVLLAPLAAADAKYGTESDIETISLYTLIQEALCKAANIEAMVKQAKAGNIYEGCDTILNQYLHDYSQSVTQSTLINIDHDFAVSISKEKGVWFRLALLAALRNTIKHTYGFDINSKLLEGDIKRMTICVTDVDLGLLNTNPNHGLANRQLLLTINNTRIGSRPTPDDGMKESGTIRALRNYARAYAGNTTSVYIKRIECFMNESREKSNERVTETFRTSIPLPSYG